MEKKLGKISSCKFGIGGYQDAMIGLFVGFKWKGGGIFTDKAAWDPCIIKVSENCKWTEEDRDTQLSDIMRFVSRILSEAKKSDVADLIGTPVELTFDGNTLKNWRILTEVL